MNQKAIDLHLDAYNYANRISGSNTESLLYLYSEMEGETDKVTSLIAGDVDMQVTGLVTLMEQVDGAFALFLDAVQQYAEENGIDIETYWDEILKEQ